MAGKSSRILKGKSEARPREKEIGGEKKDIHKTCG
jgi:hypothetical protein